MSRDVIDLAIAGKKPVAAGKFDIPLSSGRTVTIIAPLDLSASEFKEFIGDVALELPNAIVQAREMTAKPQLVRAQSIPDRLS